MSIETVTYGKVTWTNIERPTPEDIEVLRRNYNFHPLDLEDCLSKIERPKIDEYEDYLFIVMHFPVYDPDQHVSRPSEVDFFIGSGYLVTVHDGILGPIYQLFDDCQRYERTRAKHMGRGASRLLYSVIDALVDYCFPVLDKVDSLEQKDRPFIREELDVYFGDIVDHLNKARDILEDHREVIEGLSETSDSVISYRINEVMRILAIISVVMLPLTLLSGIYGMNIYLPLARHPLSFPFVIGLMILLAGGMVFYFKRRGWL